MSCSYSYANFCALFIFFEVPYFFGGATGGMIAKSRFYYGLPGPV